MGDKTNADYAHPERVWKNSEIKKFRRISLIVCSKPYIIVS